MSSSRLGLTLVIANPASHSGRGARGAEMLRRTLGVYESATDGFNVRLTEAPGDAERMAAEAVGADTVVALGGDGVIHEVVNGLMTIERELRPRLGVIPLGSGNDFARTLGLTLNNPERSLAELLAGREFSCDVGRVTSDRRPEGVHFIETLSFGLDAAIALDTVERRASGTSQEGSGLFVTSSLKVLSRARAGYPCVARLDDAPPRTLDALVFAVQNGPTYGGGFRICPRANPADGLLDVCHNVLHPRVPRLLALLALARFGLHVSSRVVALERVRRLELEFPQEEPPCQVDGEELRGTRFSAEVLPAALRVIAAPGRRYSS